MINLLPFAFNLLPKNEMYEQDPNISNWPPPGHIANGGTAGK